ANTKQKSVNLSQRNLSRKLKRKKRPNKLLKPKHWLLNKLKLLLKKLRLPKKLLLQKAPSQPINPKLSFFKLHLIFKLVLAFARLFYVQSFLKLYAFKHQPD